jgi:casein kinase II subunit alpha
MQTVVGSTARVYAEANATFGRAWWDYDGLMVSWGLQDNYEVVRKGKASFQCLLLTLHHPQTNSCQYCDRFQLTQSTEL